MREPERSDGIRLVVESVTAGLWPALSIAAGLPSMDDADEPRAGGFSQISSQATATCYELGDLSSSTRARAPRTPVGSSSTVRSR